jgi:hypothetical protein
MMIMTMMIMTTNDNDDNNNNSDDDEDDINLMINLLHCVINIGVGVCSIVTLCYKCWC